MTKEREIKPVSFNYKNDTDSEILRYLEENKIRFSTYVKELILKDINKDINTNNGLECVVDAINNLSEVIQNNSVRVVKNEEKSSNKNLSEDESKHIINNILNMH